MKLLLLFFVFLTGSYFAQILDNTKGYAFTDKPFFNETFIRVNKLKKLSGKYTVKKPGDVMRETEYKYFFNFDTLGHLRYSFETKNDNGIKDTTINYYDYSPDNLLLVHRKNDSHGYTTKMYQYDSLKRIISEETRREVIDLKGEIQQSIVMNVETMKYEDYPGQVKKTVFNSYNLPYMEVFYNYNKDGYLMEVEERLKMTSSSVRKIYEYNGKGLVASIKTRSDIEGKFDEDWLFKYDEFGNVYEKLTYKNGQQVTDIQIIYSQDTKLLSSVLTRDVRTNYIYILRFQGIEYFK